MTYSVEWLGDRVRMLDQSRLPHEEHYDELTESDDVAASIREMRVRGAPAIGVAAAYGVALAALRADRLGPSLRVPHIEAAIATLAQTRPTAVNLFAALERMRAVLQRSSPADLSRALTEEALRIHREEIEASSAISTYGASLIPPNATVLTHCNAGMIATAAHGTALGAIVEAHRQGKVTRVIATETRPLLQGARLTIWELVKAGVPATLITDSMVCHVMQTMHVDCVMVGADRIAANGDVANKIGTCGVAMLARAHRIPFYVAAPTSTVDLSVRTGSGIAIEQRSPDEVTSFAGRRVAAAGPDILNPAFDVTPHRCVTAIVTERGILSMPYTRELRECAGRAGEGRK